ncbi:hypothetical protein PACTADRAFT_50010 [Pachysolen tannophilus NRRL Y-2460]|uniref:Uncharacterized protein n=1 Tax=Pachysolen tannophilus NRRL Y-2460 TaxID=669874 RepID=A0A1E4TTY5_PACTA|nr:hypothetical protein PACTADRAFT_50010 [Pachysolen tannophilus NRRL Y-2460]
MSREARSALRDIGPLPRGDPVLANDVRDLFSLKGKVASITGSSSGIGFAVAEAFCQAGADVAIWYNSHPCHDKAEALAKKYNVKVQAYKCAINDKVAVEETILQIEKDFGTIDIFVANAGVVWTSDEITNNNDEQYKNVMECNVDSVYYCAKTVAKIFKKKGKGSFIATASMSGHIVNVPQMQAPYNASKAAVLHLARSLAVEWAGFARVNTVSPGYIKTDLNNFASIDRKRAWWSLTPMGREALPRELVGAYLYFASDASTFTTGADLVVDGGYCVA